MLKVATKKLYINIRPNLYKKWKMQQQTGTKPVSDCFHDTFGIYSSALGARDCI